MCTSCDNDVRCLLVVNSFGDVLPVDIGSLNMSRNRGIFVFFVSFSYDELYVLSVCEFHLF